MQSNKLTVVLLTETILTFYKPVGSKLEYATAW